jgi:lysyl endopeptidase
MKKVYPLLALMGFVFTVNAQVTNMGGPIGWKNKVSQKNIPIEIMPGYDQAVINAEDLIDDQTKDRPWRFGYKYQTNFTLENSGNWTTLPNGGRLWQLGISCPNAMTINLLLEDFELPSGAYLYLYDVDQTNRVGAYTTRNNRDDGLLGTELVHGNQIIVEYYEPAGVMGQGSFTISDVIHGYRSLKTIQDELWGKALNSSGDCNVDVFCPLGTGWEDQIRSVAMIVVSGSGICSGALINNTCDDGTPYFLTANHCLAGGTGNWAFRFNWDCPVANVSCATTANSVNPGPPYDQTANGATILSNGTVSDFGLLQIDNMTITDAQNWNLFYAGWDNTDALTVTQGTGIHHPSGDLKKICREDQSLTQNTAGNPTAEVWWIADWDQGVTEPGSSGSPLFDQNGRIIGQLYGGAAACSGTNDNNQFDYYGRFGISWNNGVSAILAPGGCGGATVNDGYDPNSPALADDGGIQSVITPTGQLCANNFDPEVVLRNYGTNPLTSITINYDIDAGANNTFAWTGTLASGASVNVILPNMTTTSGAHTFNASTTLPNGNADTNTGNDASSSNYNAATNGQPITLDLNMDCFGSEISWEIQDVGLNIVTSGGPYTDLANGELITVNFCLDPGCYDFVINDTYGDGMYGEQWNNCSINGDYTITEDNTSSVLATIIAANSDFGNQEVNNFCVNAPCNGTLSSSSTDVSCFGANDGTVTVNLSGGDNPITYDIGSGPQASGVFTGLAGGTFSVTVIDNSACSNIVNVVVNEPAAIADTYTVTNEIAGSDGAIDITVSGGVAPYSYAWTGPNSFSSSLEDLTGLNAGMYSVTVTDANGCSYNVAGIEVLSTVGIGENSIEFSIYPNPSNGIFNIQLNNSGNEVKIDIVDVTGRLIFTELIVGQSSFTIDLSNKADGTYFIRISDGVSQRSKPIVNQK